MKASLFRMEWILDPRFANLSDSAFRTNVLMATWSHSVWQWGTVIADDFDLVPKATAADVPQLVEAGLWEVQGEGCWKIVDPEDYEPPDDPYA